MRFFKTLKYQIEHTRSVLHLLKDIGVTHKLENWIFSPTNQPGLVIKPANIKGAEHTSDAIRKPQILQTETDLRVFVGLSNVLLDSCLTSLGLCQRS